MLKINLIMACLLISGCTLKQVPKRDIMEKVAFDAYYLGCIDQYKDVKENRKFCNSKLKEFKQTMQTK